MRTHAAGASAAHLSSALPVAGCRWRRAAATGCRSPLHVPQQAELAYDAWCLDNAYQLEEWDRQAAAAQASGSDDEWHDGSQGEEGGSGGEESGGSGDEEEEGGGDGGEDRAAWLQRRQRQLNDDMGAAMDAVHQEFLERMDVLAEAGACLAACSDCSLPVASDGVRPARARARLAGCWPALHDGTRPRERCW